MQQTEVTIINKLGLHARAAAKFVATASGFKSKVMLSHGHNEVNGKSIMGVMMLAAAQGTKIRIMVEGEDEKSALLAMKDLINNRFDEEE